MDAREKVAFYDAGLKGQLRRSGVRSPLKRKEEEVGRNILVQAGEERLRSVAVQHGIGRPSAHWLLRPAHSRTRSSPFLVAGGAASRAGRARDAVVDGVTRL